MTVRDVLLVLGALPLLGVVVWRLAAEMALARTAPSPEALPAALGVFGVVFVLYVALTLRSIARATREILARERETPGVDPSAPKAAVSDFAIHLDRNAESDLADADTAPADDEPPVAPPAPVRKKMFGEVSDLLTRIPSARSR